MKVKIVKPKVEIFPQTPGLLGMYKHIELTGRVAYKSEGKITENSWEKFNQMLYNKGHHAVFEQGTVYLSIPLHRLDIVARFVKNKHSKVVIRPDGYKVTTNYRVICQMGFKDKNEFLETYWTDFIKHHYKRVTTYWICSRGSAQEILRHRVFSPVKESTRYINYDKKFGSISFILPQWIYKVREEIGNTLSSFGESREYILNMDGQELWTELTTIDRTVSSRDDLYMAMADQYRYEITTDESYKLKPEEARGGLGLDLKCEFYLTGFLSDWNYKVLDKNSPEKAGFFSLRCDSATHPDVRVLALDLRKRFENLKYDEEK